MFILFISLLLLRIYTATLYNKGIQDINKFTIYRGIYCMYKFKLLDERIIYTTEFAESWFSSL